MNRVGTRTSNATPIQKRENKSAVMKEIARVPRAKERKSATGVKERRIWIRRNVFKGQHIYNRRAS
jgi:hypothetical protein